MICSLSRLDERKIHAIKEAEQALGKTLLAFDCLDVTPEKLTSEELSTIQVLEKEIGLTVVAVRPQ